MLLHISTDQKVDRPASRGSVPDACQIGRPTSVISGQWRYQHLHPDVRVGWPVVGRRRPDKEEVCGSQPMSRRAAAGPRSPALPAVRVGLPSYDSEPPRQTDSYCPGRARGVPDRTVISGESRSLTDTPHRRSPAKSQVGRSRPQCLQAGGQWFEPA
jgi:hypothetical protein